MSIFNWFKKQPEQVDLTEELKCIRLRNEARFKAVREQMEREGKHMNCPSFKWTKFDDWAAQKGI